MDKLRYMISDAAALVNVESHVLRYWEEELELNVPRNELGHRYYTRDNIKEFQRIKNLKDQGYQLKAIKKILKNESEEKDVDLMQVLSAEEKYEQFREMLTSIVGHAIAMNNEELSEAISNEVQEKVIKEMNYLMREQDAAFEERFKRLDESIRKRAKPKEAKEPKMSHRIRRMFEKTAEA